MITNPRAAANVADLEGKLVDWETNCRLMTENGGEEPSDESKSMSMLDMLPPEMNTYMTLHMDDSQFDTFEKL